jgi:hypothetical protein
MFDSALGVYIRVVHIDFEPESSDHVKKGLVHELLEHRGRVAQAKVHDQRLE